MVRNAAAKSIAKAVPRPSGPVTSQARALSSGDMRLPFGTRIAWGPSFGIPRGGEDALLEQRRMSGGHRALGAALVELVAALGGEVEQALLLGPFTGHLEEDPGEHAEGEEGALDHHDRTCCALVGARRDPPVMLALGVDRVEHAPRPHQHVAQHRAGEAYRDHVADLPPGREP